MPGDSSALVTLPNSLKVAATTMAQSGPYHCSPTDLAAVLQLTNNTDVAAQVCSQFPVSTLGAANAVLMQSIQSLQAHLEADKELALGLNTSFLLASAYQVFMMQTGFALYAAGVVRSKNVTMILLKNFTDACIASISFYLVGYAFAFGDNGSANGFIGNSNFALSRVETSAIPGGYAHWFWNFAFAAASTTILSGSIAERATFHSYLLYSFFMTTWVYPVVAHWLWAPSGWLSAYKPDGILDIGAIDFSGSGVVHMVGGFASLTASIILGPRTGRFSSGVPARTFKGGSAPLYALGTFLLWFGWFGFNPGSHQAISNYTVASGVARTAVVTTLAGGAGALSAIAFSFWRHSTWDLLHACTGSLAGLVAITSGCGVVTPWAGILAGLVAGPIYLLGEDLMEFLQIDDPVGAFPVHGLCGMWGVFFVGLLGNEKYIHEVYGKPLGQHLMGIFYGGHGQLLLCQFIAMVAIILWTVLWIGLLFWLLHRKGWLRVPLMAEAMGLDQAACGETSNGGINPRLLTKFENTGKFTISTAPSVAMTMPTITYGPSGGHIVPLVNGRASNLTTATVRGLSNTHGTSLMTIAESSTGTGSDPALQSEDPMTTSSVSNSMSSASQAAEVTVRMGDNRA